MTFIILQQSILQPAISAWEHFNGLSTYIHAPLGILGWKVIIHKKTSIHNSWDFHRNDGWSVGFSLERYHFQLVVAIDTKALQVSDIV